MRTALDAKLAQLQSASGIQDAVAIAEVENQVDDIAYHQGWEVPYNLTDSEKLEYENKSKAHSQRIATLDKHRGNVYALIYGQCTQILQDKMKQDKNWATGLLQAVGALQTHRASYLEAGGGSISSGSAVGAAVQCCQCKARHFDQQQVV